MQYDVRALAQDLTVSQLVIDAQDEADARRQVEARGLFVSSIVVQRKPLSARMSQSGGVSLVLFSQELLALLTAGLGVVEALEALQEKEENPAARSVFVRLLHGLREGKRFSAVLAEQPELFSPCILVS